MPEDVNFKQMFSVAFAYIERHPERGHEEFVALIVLLVWNDFYFRT
jgi:hypothetical protein